MRTIEQNEYSILGSAITNLVLAYRTIGLARCPCESMRARADELAPIVKQQLDSEMKLSEGSVNAD
jgi:hypothetical protein